ncbi:MAG: hypothetical protein ABL907_24390 [Hyphomicrobium sp.]
MSSVFNHHAVLSLLWPLLFSGAVWGIAVWALKQHDPVSELVRGLLDKHHDSVLSTPPAGPHVSKSKQS